MSVSGNEIGDLLVDIGLITPEELENAHNEQSRTGERLSLVLEKLGLVSHNQLKDALELQYGVNYISLSKNPPATEIVELIPEELRRKHRALPVAHHGTQYTIAMVDPDDIIAFDSLRLHLKSGQIKKVVCTADDFEFFIAKLQQDKELESQARQKQDEAESEKEAAKTKAAPAKKGETKKTARKTLHSLFDDDDDELEPISTSLTKVQEEAPVNAATNLMQALEEAEAHGNKEKIDEVQVAVAPPENPPESVTSIDQSSNVSEPEPIEEPSLSLDSLTPIEAVVANVATHLADIAPTITGSPLLEEIVESEFASFSESDFYESQISTKESYSPMGAEEELSRVLDMVLGDSDDLLEPLTQEESLTKPDAQPVTKPVAETARIVASEPSQDLLPETASLNELMVEALAEPINKFEIDAEADIDLNPSLDGDPLAELFASTLAEPERDKSINLEADTDEESTPQAVPEPVAEIEREPEAEPVTEPIAEINAEPEEDDETPAQAIEAAPLVTPLAEALPVSKAAEVPANFSQEMSEPVVSQPSSINADLVSTAKPVLAPVGAPAGMVAQTDTATLATTQHAPSNGNLSSQAITANPLPAVDVADQPHQDHAAPPPQVSAPTPEPAPAPAPKPIAETTAKSTPDTTPEPTPTPAPAPAPAPVPAPAPAAAPAAAQQPGEQLMSLARDIVSKAVQQKWSDIHLEPEQSTMSLRYFKSGELLADCKLPLQINQPLAGSYKRMAGLDARVSGRPQDKRFATTLNDITVELRVTTMPSDFGEMIAISIKYD